jgi:hypothetical protein
MTPGYLLVQSSRSALGVSTLIDARGHAKAVQFYFMQPLRCRRRLLDGLGKPRRDEARKRPIALVLASARGTGLGGRGGTPDDTRHGANLNSTGSRPLTRVCRKRLPQYSTTKAASGDDSPSIHQCMPCMCSSNHHIPSVQVHRRAYVEGAVRRCKQNGCWSDLFGSTEAAQRDLTEP